MQSNPFSGRSLITISDFTHAEMLYFFNFVKLFKIAFLSDIKEVLKRFMIDNQPTNAYTIFTENSTRTKGSFTRALDFHQTNNPLFKHPPFDPNKSSFNKSESWEDTINTLLGYSNKYLRNLFIIRSKLEGVCRWLQYSSSAYAKRHDLLPPVFINAGDGKHEHPTQELLDEYTFLEDSNWQNDFIHIALIGDLLHGRTVHSKVNGLGLFKEVVVDLVAPNEIQLPQHYVDQMLANGYQVNFFESVDEYVATNKKIADKWYLTRPQLERLGDDLKPVIEKIRSKIIFKQEHLSAVGDVNLKLYHPFPRFKAKPSLPRWLNDHPFNAYERQSNNGFYTRVVIISLLLGEIGNGFTGQIKTPDTYSEDFITEINLKDKINKVSNEGINPIKNGVVIDHISVGELPEQISKRVIKIRKILGIKNHWYAGVAQSRKTKKDKGLIFLPGYQITESNIKVLATIEPGATLNIIKNSKVVRKLSFKLPQRIYNIDQTACNNPNCISYPEHHEGVMPDFIRNSDSNGIFICRYCGQPHTYREIWKEIK